MKVTSLRNVCFSPTGITARYAAAIVKTLALPICNYDISAPCPYNYSLAVHNTGKHLRHCSEEHMTAGIREVTIIGAPVYAGRIPRLVSQRLASITGAKNPAIIFVSYGNRDYDDALLELCDQAETCGFIVVGAAAFPGRHSILPCYATNRPDKDDLAVAADFARQCRTIIDDMTNTAHAPMGARIVLSPRKQIQGSFPYKQRTGTNVLPMVDSRCDQCQVCAMQCPVLAIPMENPSKTADHCIHCGRCILRCHTGARHLPDDYLNAVKERLDPLCQTPKQAALFYAAYEQTQGYEQTQSANVIL